MIVPAARGCAWCPGELPPGARSDTGVVTRAWAELSLAAAVVSDARSSTAAGPGDVSSGSGSRRRMAQVLGDASSGPNPGTALA